MSAILSVSMAAAAGWLFCRPPRRRVSLLPACLVTWRWIRQRLESRRRRTSRRVALRDAIAEVAADVRAGQPPAAALERALPDGDLAPRTLSAVRLGGDVVAALHNDASRSSQPLLAGVGACWSVSESQGAGLATALERLVLQERRAEEVRRQLQAHLAAPRATARMLAVLPALGLGLGLAVGGDPIGWLLGTTLGWGCLAAGLVLIGVGMAWAGRIASRTERLL
jgi:tight adherence protein B